MSMVATKQKSAHEFLVSNEMSLTAAFLLQPSRWFWSIKLLQLRPLEPEHVCYGLVLCFSHRSAKIEPVLATPILAGTGGGWIDMGLVIMDRF